MRRRSAMAHAACSTCSPLCTPTRAHPPRPAHTHLGDVRAKHHAHAAAVVGAEPRVAHRVAPQHVRREARDAQAVGVHAALARARQVLQRPQRHVLQPCARAPRQGARWEAAASGGPAQRQAARQAPSVSPAPPAPAHRAAAAEPACACSCPPSCAVAACGTGRRAAPGCAAPRAPPAAARQTASCTPRKWAAEGGP